MKFEVVWNENMGDVFVNGEQISQLCFDGESVGFAIGSFLENGNQFNED